MSENRLLLLLVGPPDEAAGLTEHLALPSVDIKVCVDVAEAVRVLRTVNPGPPPDERPVRTGALRLDPVAQEAELHGRRILLPPRESRLLHLLMTHAGQVVSRDRIRETVWDGGERDASNTITVHIQRLRARLGDGTIIHTVRRLGYRLVPPPRRTASPRRVRVPQ